jgi:hypothetical protein
MSALQPDPVAERQALQRGARVRLLAADLADKEGRYVERFGDWHLVDVDGTEHIVVPGEFELVPPERDTAMSTGRAARRTDGRLGTAPVISGGVPTARYLAGSRPGPGPRAGAALSRRGSRLDARRGPGARGSAAFGHRAGGAGRGPGQAVPAMIPAHQLAADTRDEIEVAAQLAHTNCPQADT